MYQTTLIGPVQRIFSHNRVGYESSTGPKSFNRTIPNLCGQYSGSDGGVLFNECCLGGASWSIKQWFASYIVFMSIALVIILQLIFTDAPFMSRLFETIPIS
ncbi:hypothetical protein [Methylophaga sp.]|uniref:hypothetical protein n=1 Tax=Methylophaga sp. TaxID=2024840 RepID=UPI0027192ADD|nr:hypothetical protein [Methylophaga sp.]MDO8827901.1 hypothetical protein [Methylophaga sp.]